MTSQEFEFPWANDWPEIRNPSVRAAFARVSRKAFINSEYRAFANRDSPLPIGEGQTISQPFVVALMTQSVEPVPGDKVLEIGTGSGFQTAILCELTRDAIHEDEELVFSIERHASLAERAVSRLANMGYTPRVRTDDGAKGWPEYAPYRAIVVTAAAKCLPRPLWEQLDDGGRIVIPIGGRFGAQTLWIIEKADGEIKPESLGPVRFVPLVSPILDLKTNCIGFNKS